MKVIVGLGNPGPQYAMTRHNAGMMLVDRISQILQSDYGWRREKDIMIYKTPGLWLVKSAGVFMNESGRMIRSLQIKDYELWLAHDDLDIKLGEYKIQKGVGPKVHGGVNSVENAAGSVDFWRVRIGIDNRTRPMDGEEYVLQKFTPEELEVLDGVLEKISHEIIEATN
jgi:peptidyl-tRNA hydrolase, PTH1 family